MTRKCVNKGLASEELGKPLCNRTKTTVQRKLLRWHGNDVKSVSRSEVKTSVELGLTKLYDAAVG